MENMAVFVDSFDGNSDLWDTFFGIMHYYWKDCSFKKYLVTNMMEYSKYEVNSIKVGDNTDWVNCTLEGLKKVPEKYIFFMFEDYFFSKNISNDQIKSILDTMRERDIFFYRLSLINGLDRTKDAVPISKDFPYVINLQPAIWERTTLIFWLENMKEQGLSTPWQFEFFFIDKANNYELPLDNGFIKGVLYDTRDIMGYQNAVIQGKWVRRVIRKYRSNPDIHIELGEREFMSCKNEVWDSIKQLGHVLIPYKKRESMKKALKKMNIKFMR